MVAILIMSEKLGTLSLFKIKIFWDKGYDVVNFAPDVTNKILSRELNNIVEVVMWEKFGNSSISMREVIITSILQGFDQKNKFSEGCSCFKYNNFGLTLGMALKLWYKDYN